MKKLLLTIVFSFFAIAMFSQTDSTANANAPVQTEYVSGIWGVMGYMGDKISKSFKTKMNTSDGSSDEVPTKVRIKIAGFVVERVENRPKN
ncbi:MAG: hypothetical protein HRT74_11135 [Flavobacteriales bacterium]|nr:hypothetical protein [Flavobacteriales bacterium]